MGDNKLHLSGDESRDMWEDINSIKPEKLQRIIYHIMCHTQNAEGDLSNAIKALTENIEGQELRLTDLENLVDQHLRPQLREQPITFGISNSGPVPNDGKAKPDLSQRPPFVTGLSVLDSLKK